MMRAQGSTRIVRVIARLNIGGPAIQAITLTRRLEDRGYRTVLVRGHEAPTEGSMDYLADQLGVQPTLISHMRRDPGPGDLAALARLVRVLRAERPQIVHTHAAKAGTLGRLAVLIAFPRHSKRPVLVHTYHGHSLTGYFSGRTEAFYLRVERALAKYTDALVAVSDQVRDDLVRLGVAGPDRFVVVPLGFDLAPFADGSSRAERRSRTRREWDIDERAEVVTLIARLVPIKRVDRFLRVARLLAAQRPLARFVIVGDGELREDLSASEDGRALAGRLTWAGFRRDMPDVCFASDVVVLTSDNEGTPVSLIEAQAAATPVVSTDVGGVAAVVRDGETGFLIDSTDERGMADAIARVLDAPDLAARLATNGAQRAAQFELVGLVERIDRLYRRLLGEPEARGLNRRPSGPPTAPGDHK